MDADLAEELRKIKAHKRSTRQMRRYESKLEPFRGEIFARLQAGYKVSDIQYWLHKNKKLKVHWTTVKRFIENKHYG
jgi:hypothetical protein